MTPKERINDLRQKVLREEPVSDAALAEAIQLLRLDREGKLDACGERIEAKAEKKAKAPSKPKDVIPVVNLDEIFQQK